MSEEPRAWKVYSNDELSEFAKEYKDAIGKYWKVQVKAPTARSAKDLALMMISEVKANI